MSNNDHASEDASAGYGTPLSQKKAAKKAAKAAVKLDKKGRPAKGTPRKDLPSASAKAKKLSKKQSKTDEAGAAAAAAGDAQDVVKVVKVRKPHRFRPGTVALRQIRKYQKSTETLISKAGIRRVIREIATDNKPDLRFQDLALEALHVAVEDFLIDVLREAQDASIHRKGVTIEAGDLKYVVGLMNKGLLVKTQSGGDYGSASYKKQ